MLLVLGVVIAMRREDGLRLRAADRRLGGARAAGRRTGRRARMPGAPSALAFVDAPLSPGERPRRHHGDADGERLVDVARAEPRARAGVERRRHAGYGGDRAGAQVGGVDDVGRRRRVEEQVAARETVAEVDVGEREPLAGGARRPRPGRVDDEQLGAQGDEPAAGGAADRAEPEEQHRPAGEAAGRRRQRRHVAVGGRRVVVDADTGADVQGDEAEVVGDEDDLVAARPPPPAGRARRGTLVTRASQPRCRRIAATHSQKPGMNPSPVLTGTAATRAPSKGTGARRGERRRDGRRGHAAATVSTPHGPA